MCLLITDLSSDEANKSKEKATSCPGSASISDEASKTFKAKEKATSSSDDSNGRKSSGNTDFIFHFGWRIRADTTSNKIVFKKITSVSELCVVQFRNRLVYSPVPS